MIWSCYRCCCITFSHWAHLKLGHRFHALLKVCSDRGDMFPLKGKWNQILHRNFILLISMRVGCSKGVHIECTFNYLLSMLILGTWGCCFGLGITCLSSELRLIHWMLTIFRWRMIRVYLTERNRKVRHWEDVKSQFYIGHFFCRYQWSLAIRTEPKARSWTPVTTHVAGC